MKPILLLPILLVFVGCNKGYDPELMRRLSREEHSLIGKYQLEMEFSGEGAKELRELVALLSGLEGGDTTLECLPDKTFTMMASGVKVTGDWRLESPQLWLQIKQVGDKKPSEIAKVELGSMFKSGFDMSGKERDEFLSGYRNSMALEQAEGLTNLRVGVDGALYAQPVEGALFGASTSYFKRVKE